jgi:succinoglycan biosynthesis transport protein ExoP
MTFQQFFMILRARYKVVLLTLLVIVAIAVAASLLLPQRYKADTSLVIDFKGVDQVMGIMLPAQLMPSYIATQVDIIQSHSVALKVVKALKLVESPVAKEKFLEDTQGRGSIEDWLADLLLKKLDVKPSRESSIVDVIYTNPDPDFAAAAANAFARAYIQTNLELKVSPAKETAVWFDGQLKQLRDDFEEAQGRLSKYQRDKGITSTDQRLDVEAAKLSEISSQLVQVEAQVFESTSRQKQLEEFTTKNRNADSLPEVLASPVIGELKARLSAAEARVNQASNTMGKNHPDYQRAQSEVDSLHKKLVDEIKTVASVINNNLKIMQSREKELRDAVAAQKAKLLELNRHRDELGVLMKEVDNAQHAYEAASQRYTQTNLESQTNQTNIAILSPAIPPLAPSFPKLPLNVALALVLGTMLGVGMALLREMFDRRVRVAQDLAEAVGVQVWGVLENTASLSRRSGRRGLFFRKSPMLKAS